MRALVIAAAMGVASMAATVSADTLILKDGTRIQGTVLGVAARTVTFKGADGVSHRYAMTKVESLQFDSPVPAPALAAARRAIEVPAGTELVVRTTETVDSQQARPDQTFMAIFEQGVTNAAGRVIVPVGAQAALVIRQVTTGGATGSPEMALDIQSITIDGRQYAVSTTDLVLDSDTGVGKNQRTAKAIGGGAAVGTVIGAITGGAKGAVIGGTIGAAGGAAAQVLTRGHDVRVPVETVLRFRLDRAVALRSES